MTNDERARALFFALEKEDGNDGAMLAIAAAFAALELETVERCANVAATTPSHPDTLVGTKQAWLKEQIEARILAMLAPAKDGGT